MLTVEYQIKRNGEWKPISAFREPMEDTWNGRQETLQNCADLNHSTQCDARVLLHEKGKKPFVYHEVTRYTRERELYGGIC